MKNFYITLIAIVFIGCSSHKTPIDNFGKKQPLMVATLANDVGLVETIIKKGDNLNIQDKKGGTALTIASYYGYKKIVELLLVAGANPNIPTKKANYTPLMFAKQFGHKEVIGLLLSYGAIQTKEVFYNKNARALLYCELGELQEVKRLVEVEKVDVNARYSNTKSTLIIEAVKSGNRELVDFLVENSADSYLEDVSGLHALDYADSLEMEIVTKKMFLTPH